MAIIFHCLQMISWMGCAVYLTSLALNLIFPLRAYQSILLTTGICSFYAVMGGMKAIVWVDSIQSVMMFGGILAVCIQTTLLKGGIAEVWRALDEGQRNTFWNFSPDVTSGSTLWATVLGNTIAWFYYTCCIHAITQRFQSCKNVRQSRIAALIFVATAGTLFLLCAVNGLLAYAHFEDCDPLASGQISALDQLIPFLVVKIFSDVPGMAGIFVVAVYSGMLSTVSSGLNAISGLLLAEFIRPRFPRMSEKKSMQVSKLSGLVFGFAVAGDAFLMKSIGSTAMQLVLTMDSIFGGPIFGVFVAGLFLPWTNTIGAGIGLVTGVSLAGWIAMGQILCKVSGSGPELPTSVAGCMNATTTSLNSTLFATEATSFATEASTVQERTATIYDVSYFYIGAIGILTTVTVSLVTSFITGKRDARRSDPKLFAPLIGSELVPGRVRTCLRCGVPDDVMDSDDDEKPRVLAVESRATHEEKRDGDETTNNRHQTVPLVDIRSDF